MRKGRKVIRALVAILTRIIHRENKKLGIFYYLCGSYNRADLKG